MLFSLHSCFSVLKFGYGKGDFFMGTYFLMASLENFFDKNSVFGFILSGIIALLCIILVIAIALVPFVLFIKLMLFVIRKSNDISKKRQEKWEAGREERERISAEKELCIAKERFIKNLPDNLPRCARALDTVKELSSCYSEALDFFQEAKAMLDEQESKGNITFGEKNAIIGDFSQKHLEGIRCYRNKDTEKALQWLFIGAERGFVESQRSCAMIYEGEDNEKAMYWYEKAAEDGDKNDMIFLADTYYLGKICRKDLLEAAKWFEKAGDKGDAKSYHNAAVCYSEYAGIYMEKHGIKNGDTVREDCPALKYAWKADEFEKKAIANGYKPQ